MSLRWLGVHAAALALVAAFIALGYWQLDRALAEAAPRPAPDQPAVPLVALASPDQVLDADAAGRLVTATGRYDGGRQLLLPGRDQAGSWVLTPLRTPDGAAIPVVRGLAPTADDQAASAPSGEVSVTGRLQPSEVGRLDGGSINTGELIQQVPYDLYDGYLVLTQQSPAGELSLVEAPAATTRPGFPLQNSAYALQWWLFAGFVLFVWWRIVRDARQAAGLEPERATLVP